MVLEVTKHTSFNIFSIDPDEDNTFMLSPAADAILAQQNIFREVEQRFLLSDEPMDGAKVLTHLEKYLYAALEYELATGTTVQFCETGVINVFGCIPKHIYFKEIAIEL